MTGALVYAVFADGVYRHECGGIFGTFDEAKACADAMANDDHDDYHEYQVVPFAFGIRTLEEAQPAYRARKVTPKPRRGHRP